MMEMESMIQHEAAQATEWQGGPGTAVPLQPEGQPAALHAALRWTRKLRGFRGTVTPA